MQPTILTRAGRLFDLVAPNFNAVSIFEIAHALSQICRFTGHCLHHYSVAQHSVLVSRLVPPPLAFEGLMHDAHEAFVGDVASPLKMLLPDFKTVEGRIEQAMREHFGLPFEHSPEVKRADLVALATEQSYLMPKADNVLWHWQERGDIKPVLAAAPRKLSPIQARGLFLKRFQELAPRAKEPAAT